jgi:hypothetical protein
MRRWAVSADEMIGIVLAQREGPQHPAAFSPLDPGFDRVFDFAVLSVLAIKAALGGDRDRPTPPQAPQRKLPIQPVQCALLSFEHPQIDEIGP